MPENTSPGQETSAAGAIGSGLGSALRAVTHPETRRVMRGVSAGASAFLKVSADILHMLFLEVTGFIFLCFAVIGSFAFFREYRKYAAGQVGAGKLIVAGCFGAMFLWFGATSFWRARRKKR